MTAGPGSPSQKRGVSFPGPPTYDALMGTYARERAKDRITELAARGDDLVTFWRESTELLERTVPHYWTPCWFTLDPASLLVTSHFHDGLAELPAEWMANEYYEDDVNKLTDVARSSAASRRCTRPPAGIPPAAGAGTGT